MKILIASDIHGSAYWCRKLMEKYVSSGAERMLLLGDLLYHGPRNDLPDEYAPREVIGMLNEHKNEIYAVRGNCEAEVDQMVLDFPVMAEYCLLPLRRKMAPRKSPIKKEENVWMMVIGTSAPDKIFALWTRPKMADVRSKAGRTLFSSLH